MKIKGRKHIILPCRGPAVVQGRDRVNSRTFKTRCSGWQRKAGKYLFAAWVQVSQTHHTVLPYYQWYQYSTVTPRVDRLIFLFLFILVYYIGKYERRVSQSQCQLSTFCRDKKRSNVSPNHRRGEFLSGGSFLL